VLRQRCDVERAVHWLLLLLLMVMQRYSSQYAPLHAGCSQPFIRLEAIRRGGGPQWMDGVEFNAPLDTV